MASRNLTGVVLMIRNTRRAFLTTLSMSCAALAVMSFVCSMEAADETLFFDPGRPGFESPGGLGMATGGSGTWSVFKDFTAFDEIPLGVDITGAAAVLSHTIQVDEQIANNTGIDWLDFHLEVDPIDAPDDLLVQFNNVMVPTGMTFQTMDNALWVFGSVPTGTDFLLIYEMEVTSNISENALFAVREHPTVPEPPALVLVVIGVGVWVWRVGGRGSHA